MPGYVGQLHVLRFRGTLVITPSVRVVSQHPTNRGYEPSGRSLNSVTTALTDSMPCSPGGQISATDVPSSAQVVPGGQG